MNAVKSHSLWFHTLFAGGSVASQERRYVMREFDDLLAKVRENELCGQLISDQKS